jgi:hypothetical protein
MNRTLLVLALAISSSAGCRAVCPPTSHGCGDACAVGGEGCGPVGCCESCGNEQCNNGSPCGCLQNSGGACFGRFCCNSGCGVPGVHDCSACDSPGWGCNGYGYCPDGCRGACGGHGPLLRNGYCCCCGKPAPSCCCASGDHRYNFMPGPPVGQTAYPYYTVRGPRDFLQANPPGLGPF